MHERERWASSVIEDHIYMVYAEGGEVSWAVEGRVEADDESDVACDEVTEDIFERTRDIRHGDFWYAGGKVGILW